MTEAIVRYQLPYFWGILWRSRMLRSAWSVSVLLGFPLAGCLGFQSSYATGVLVAFCIYTLDHSMCTP